MNEETLFELAVNTPPTERAALLDRERAGNPGLSKERDRRYETANGFANRATRPRRAGVGRGSQGILRPGPGAG